MLKICDSVLTEPLSITFQNYSDPVVFPNTWKMSHIIPIHKKDDKRSLNNYRSVSLLPICGKIFEKTIFNDVFLFLENNNLLTLRREIIYGTNFCNFCEFFAKFAKLNPLEKSTGSQFAKLNPWKKRYFFFVF